MGLATHFLHHSFPHVTSYLILVGTAIPILPSSSCIFRIQHVRNQTKYAKILQHLMMLTSRKIFDSSMFESHHIGIEFLVETESCLASLTYYTHVESMYLLLCWGLLVSLVQFEITYFHTRMSSMNLEASIPLAQSLPLHFMAIRAHLCLRFVLLQSKFSDSLSIYVFSEFASVALLSVLSEM